MAAPSGNSGAVNLKVGEDYRVRLKGLGSAGYDWDYTVEGDANAIQVVRDTSQQQQQQRGQAGGPRTSSVDDVFRIRALAAGSVTVRFAQSRPWERGKRPPLNQSTLQVSVTNF